MEILKAFWHLGTKLMLNICFTCSDKYYAYKCKYRRYIYGTVYENVMCIQFRIEIKLYFHRVFGGKNVKQTFFFFSASYNFFLPFPWLSLYVRATVNIVIQRVSSRNPSTIYPEDLVSFVLGSMSPGPARFDFPPQNSLNRLCL